MRLRILALLGAGVVACGGDAAGPDGDALPAGLIGEWFTGPSCYPQCGLTLIPVDSPADSLNVTVSSTTGLRLTSGGSFRLEIGAVGNAVITGRAKAEGGTLILTESNGSADTVDYQLSGERWLQLRFRQTRPGDLNGDGVEEQIRLQGRWQRR